VQISKALSTISNASLSPLISDCL